MGRLQKLFRRARRTYLGREDSKIIGARCGETGESLSISADCECSVFTQPTHRSGAVAADDRRKDRRQWARPNGRVRKKALHSHPAPPRQPHPSVLACCAAIRLFAPPSIRFTPLLLHRALLHLGVAPSAPCARPPARSIRFAFSQLDRIELPSNRSTSTLNSPASINLRAHIMAATGTPRLSTYSTPATPANRSLSVAPGTQLSQTGNNASAGNASAAQQAPPLPPPATFDILPHLHALLNRLLIQKPADATGAQQAGGEDGGNSKTDDSNNTSGNAAKSGGAAAAAAPPSDADAQPLEIHQLTAASSALKVRLQKARQACARLGDMDRTVEEQQEEIEELEDRVKKLRAVLEDMGVATRAAAGSGDTGNEMVLRAPNPV